MPPTAPGKVNRLHSASVQFRAREGWTYLYCVIRGAYFYAHELACEVVSCACFATVKIARRFH